MKTRGQQGELQGTSEKREGREKGWEGAYAEMEGWIYGKERWKEGKGRDGSLMKTFKDRMSLCSSFDANHAIIGHLHNGA